jgi:hypothetical protein
MKHRCFLNNLFGVSVMYDAILFIVMVSLSGVILLPALRSPTAVESSVEKHREQVVDEALHTFLVSRADSFEYTLCSDLIDDVAGNIGIDNSSGGLYSSITRWLLGHEQRHKTYAALVAENLGCQFQLPFTFFGSHRLNIFTGDFDRQLSNETKRFFSSVLGDKYRFNFTAHYHPIKGVPFGGELSIGDHPPTTDCYVAHSIIMMPYSPVLSFGNHTIVFTKHWLKHQLFSEETGFGRSSIPAIANMTLVFENYTNGHPPYDTREHAIPAIQENLSSLVYGFLISGITNTSNVTIFPGIINITLTYGFEKIKNITKKFLNETLNETFGEAIRLIDRLFGSLNETADNPLSQWILQELNTTIHGMFNGTFNSLDEALDACEAKIKEQVTALVKSFLDSYIETFVIFMFNVIDAVVDFADMLVDWLFDRICLNAADATLTIWAVRE